MSEINISINEETLRELVVKYIAEKMSSVTVKKDDVHIETKSEQNFRSEWETAAYQATARVKI